MSFKVVMAYYLRGSESLQLVLESIHGLDVALKVTLLSGPAILSDTTRTLCLYEG